MRIFGTQDGTCPEKDWMLSGADGSFMSSLVGLDSVVCDPECTGPVPVELKIWRIPLGTVRVCPLILAEYNPEPQA